MLLLDPPAPQPTRLAPQPTRPVEVPASAGAAAGRRGLAATLLAALAAADRGRGD